MKHQNLELKRWLIAGAAIIMQLCLGTVYAWSVFKRILMETHGWSETGTQATFMIAIASISIAAAFGGGLVDKKGPRFVATMGGILFGIGTILAGVADQIGSLWLLYLGYGFIAGLGNGFSYITPIAMLIRWFPDRRGLVTGLAVMGFGAGAFIMGKIAPATILHFGVANTFYIGGVVFLILVTLTAQFFKKPPSGWVPKNFKPPEERVSAANSLEFKDAIRTRQWWLLWTMLFLNITAGIGLISQLSPMSQEIVKGAIENISAADLAVAGGTILAIASIFNGVGRFVWAWISDFIGRKGVFSLIFITEAVLFILLPQISSYVLFAIVASYLLSCYGGSFSTMPAFAADAFGSKHIGQIYGVMLTAWGAAGIVGPLLFAWVKQSTESFETALYISSALLFVGFVITLLYKKPKPS
jgi:MFS transporter, OFA family, oxalate/formate antiporter